MRQHYREDNRAFSWLRKSFHKYLNFGFKNGSSGNSKALLQWLILALFILLYGAFSSFYTINPSQLGVVIRLGKFYKISEEGPHFKLPFNIDNVYIVEVTRLQVEEFGFRSQGSLSEKQKRKERLMMTGDLKFAIAEWSVQYIISDPKKFLFNSVDVRAIIRETIMSSMRSVIGDFTVTDVLTTSRALIGSNAKEASQKTLDLFDIGITIVNFNIQSVNPPDAVREAYDEVNIARQERDQKISEAKGVYNKLIPEAKGKAKKAILEAKAYKIKVVEAAKADVDRFALISKEYQKNPTLTKSRLYLDTMEKVFKKDIIVVDPKTQGIIPIYSDNNNLTKLVEGKK